MLDQQNPEVASKATSIGRVKICNFRQEQMTQQIKKLDFFLVYNCSSFIFFYMGWMRDISSFLLFGKLNV